MKPKIKYQWTKYEDGNPRNLIRLFRSTAFLAMKRNQDFGIKPYSLAIYLPQEWYKPVQ